MPWYILPFYPIISEVRLRQEVVNNPLACQDAFRDDRMEMWRVHVHRAARLSDDDDGSFRLPPPPPPPPSLPAYDVAQLQAGEAVGPKGVDANKFDFLAKGVIPCVFFSSSFLAKLRGKKSEMIDLSALHCSLPSSSSSPRKYDEKEVNCSSTS